MSKRTRQKTSGGVKHRALSFIGAALIVGGALIIGNSVRISLPQWQLKFGLYPHANDDKAFTQGQKAYQRRCQGCHGANGELSAHNHAIKEHIGMHNPADYYEIITTGDAKQGMPPFGQSLTSSQRWKLVSYLFKRFHKVSRQLDAKTESKR